MIRVDQAIIDKSFGDCQRAVYASLLELPLDAVPNFIRHGIRFNMVLRGFLATCGWKLDYITGHFYKDMSTYAEGFENKYKRPQIDTGIGGYFAASVKSRTYEHTNHCVVININGLVVHDPNPNKLYQGINIIDTEELKHWDLVSVRNDKEWDAWKGYELGRGKNE